MGHCLRPGVLERAVLVRGPEAGGAPHAGTADRVRREPQMVCGFCRPSYEPVCCEREFFCLNSYVIVYTLVNRTPTTMTGIIHSKKCVMLLVGEWCERLWPMRGVAVWATRIRTVQRARART